uniref:Carboxylic ester hydrolase n=1 Tax=Parastrongyloides trichosuri TaxID=131310 RepID=A0A0N4ZLI4_PARTI
MKNKHLILFFILVFYSCYSVLKGDEESSATATTQVIEEQSLVPQNVTVEIQHFNVTGKKFVFMNKNITEFLGVPFAYPHNSSRRFLPSLPINGANVRDFKNLKNNSFVNNSYQAFTLANACPQYINKTGFIGMDMLIPNTEVSEDCLQLNMWVPDKNESENNGKNMSTIVFLYGGSFAVGSASINFYNGSVLALTQNVIVITLNYRIGPLGFAYFGEDTEAKGNVGLLDQQEGLKWISKNIGYFGGNKSDITLFGESAGAASATAHLLANNSHKYFDKIIVNSGAITNVWATVSQTQALNNTLWLAKLMNCNNKSSEEEITQNNTEVLKCMQENNVNLTVMNNIYQFEVRDEEQPPFPYPF